MRSPLQVLRSNAGRRMLAAISVAGASILLGHLWYFFSPWLALWSLALGAIFQLRPAAGLALLLPAISIDRVETVWGGIAVSFSEFQFALCVLAFLFYLSRSSEPPTPDWRWLAWGAAFTLAVVLSGAVNNEWWRVVPHTVRQSELVLAGWLACNAVRGGGDRSWFGWSIVGSAWLFSALGILQSPTLGTTRSAAVFTNPNLFGAYLNLLLPFLLLFWLQAEGAVRKTLLSSALALTLLAGLLAQSRAAWAATLVLAAAFFWLALRSGSLGRTRPVMRRLGGLAGVAALGGVLLAAVLWLSEGGQYFQRFWTALQQRTRVQTTSDVLRSRLPFFRAGWQIWRESPWLGIGPGNYEEKILEYRHLWPDAAKPTPGATGVRPNLDTHVHNLALQLLVNFGILGLGAFGYLIGRFALVAKRRLGDDPWAAAGLALLAGFLTHNLLDVSFPSLGLETGLLLGAATPFLSWEEADSDG